MFNVIKLLAFYIVSQEEILEGKDQNQIMICVIVENKLYEQDMLDIFIKSIMKREFVLNQK